VSGLKTRVAAMTSTTCIRATAQPGTPSEKPSIRIADPGFPVVAQHMYMLMLRNITTDGYVVNDPYTGQASQPGCVIAAPSYRGHTPNTDQDYVFNWMRDAAITMFEIAAADLSDQAIGGVQTLTDYVNFAALCQSKAQPTLGHACFTVGGDPRPWTEQSDGPALQTLAILQAYTKVDAPTQATARAVIQTNLDYLLAQYQNPTFNLWEEHQGLSFFARSVQLRCFQAISANTLGIAKPAGLAAAITWLQDALGRHWNGSYYISMLAPPAPGSALSPLLPESVGYDANIDIVCACLYGAIPCIDTQLLATAALLRSQWADPNSAAYYPINGDDAGRGLGPMLGRYPGDVYDGDMANQQRGDHPWALCTCNLAELYYRVANSIVSSNTIPFDDKSAAFFTALAAPKGTSVEETAQVLRDAGDKMLRAVLFHSDHLELSEQFDGANGFEKSVSNLTWSYAAFLSAVRNR
jgi:glucoamylase